MWLYFYVIYYLNYVLHLQCLYLLPLYTIVFLLFNYIYDNVLFSI